MVGARRFSQIGWLGLFLLPGLIGLLVFTIAPLLASLVLTLFLTQTGDAVIATISENDEIGMAAIKALESLKRPVMADLYTDSQYVRGGITGVAHEMFATIAPELPLVDQVVFTCGDGRLARLAAAGPLGRNKGPF